VINCRAAGVRVEIFLGLCALRSALCDLRSAIAIDHLRSPDSRPQSPHAPHPHSTERSAAQPQAKSKKRRYWLVLKEIIRPAPRFFCVCWHGTSKQHFHSKNKFAPRSWWSCSATASGSRATHGGTIHPHPGLISTPTRSPESRERSEQRAESPHAHTQDVYRRPTQLLQGGARSHTRGARARGARSQEGPRARGGGGGSLPRTTAWRPV
jgi:hypothetical protein